MQLYLAAFAIMSYLALQIAWPNDASYYAVFFVWGFIGSFGFSGVVLPMVSAVVLPEMRSTAFAFLHALLQGFKAAVISLLVGWLADQFGLPPIMFWILTVAYAINAVYWFVFYRAYPKDVERMQNTLLERSGTTAAAD
jgi:fucose permease